MRSALVLLACAACVVIWWMRKEGRIQAASPAAELDWNWDPGSARYGPGEWSKKYTACGVAPQSPINFTVADGNLPGGIEFNYREFESRVMTDQDGYKFEVKVANGKGGGILIGGTTYILTDFHLHTLSEHTFGGEHADLEVHLVHSGPNSSLAVVGVLMDKVASGGNGLVKDMMTNASGTLFKANASRFLPVGNRVRYYSYQGSLTTPGCAPVAHWMVAASPKGERPTVDEGDIQELQKSILRFSINQKTGSKYPYNNRPVQVPVRVFQSK